MKRARDHARERGDEFEIVIAGDGRVIFRTATAEMIDVARALAPEDPRLQARGARARRVQRGKADENRAAGGD